ncbi:hypothetical protein HF1_07430 [Mycoplasma haemofelis str. Langford 1]|uniref:Uncharacterized protein n=1 Tax=Mycoplasma haemofelis (strain Langford 1) TaxID=941640 RepID=E8ZHY0_MYCHL|nr:hypothetical protein [Mycoplasma haemofelis]CBY92751.1 hypothetical protein HF1_07430 [Mycoplasma haemofelis str. Langford 1]
MSALAPLKLAGLSCLGVGGTCSVVYAGSSWVSGVSSLETDDDNVIQTVADKFSNRLIGKDKTSIWQTRLQKLKTAESGKELAEGLKAIKDGADKKESDLRAWCEEAKIKPQEGEGSKLIVEGVQDYCTYTIKDQANGTMSKTKTNVSDWKEVNTAFSKMKRDSLSEDLQAVWDKVKDKIDTSGDLKDWCFKKYDEPFEGRDSATYKDVVKVCKTVPKPAVAKPAAAKPAASKPDSQS